jgi:hypothetical protein
VGTMTRRLAALTVVTAAIVAGVAGPAGAQAIDVSGPFTGSGTFDFSCDFAHETNSGTGDWTGLGAVTWSLDFCVAIPPDLVHDPWPVTSGTFTVTAPTGTLTGTMGGTVTAGLAEPDGRFPFSYVLTVTGGTGEVAGATGQLTLDGLLEYVPLFGRNLDGTVSGTVTVPPVAHTPATKDDCKQGGWQTLTNEAGAPFRNQGACVSWADHHT